MAVPAVRTYWVTPSPISVTVVEGDILVAVPRSSTGSENATAVALGAQGFTPLLEQHGSGVDLELWYLVAPTVGSGTVTVTGMGNAAVLAITGASSSDFVRGSKTASGVDSVSISLPSQAGCLVLYTCQTSGASPNISGATNIFTAAAFSADKENSAGSGSDAASYTGSLGNYLAQAIEIGPATRSNFVFLG